jgi:hypothetical protein
MKSAYIMTREPVPDKTSPTLLLNAAISHTGDRGNNDSAAVSFWYANVPIPGMPIARMEAPVKNN